MLKSKKTILGVILRSVITLCLAICIFTGISTSKTAYASKESKTISDILPTNFPLCVDVLPDNTWVNENGIHMMLIQNTLGVITTDGKDYVLAEDIRTTTLTEIGTNYSYTNNGVTTIFVMNIENKLVKVQVSGIDEEEKATFNGTYHNPQHIHNEGTDNEISFTLWNGGTEHNSMPTEAGNYVLTCDITLSETWTVSEGATNLCLNGHVINANGGNFSVITVGENATLNLYDCDTTTSHNGYVDIDGLWHLGEGEGTSKSIIGGIITGGNTTIGGGVYVNKGEFNMYGGNIVGNKTTSNGGGVSVTGSSSSFTMLGNSRISNNIGASGGGVYVMSASFKMTGGVITENVANYGGGCILSGSSPTLGGIAQIIGNTAKGVTNNVFLNNKAITLDNPTTLNVGLTLSTGTGKFTANGTANYSSNFFSDSDSYKVCFYAGTGTEGDEYLELKTAYLIINNTKEDDKATNHGYIIVDKNAVENEEVAVTVVANEGYRLSSLKYNDGTDHDITSTKSFTMKTTAVSVTASFVEKQTISISENPYNCAYNGEPRAFQITSGEGPIPTGLKFEYYVNGAWIETAPTNVGSYNVKITREEDDTYKAFSTQITNGLVIAKASHSINIVGDISKVYDMNCVSFNIYSEEFLKYFGDGDVTVEFKLKNAEDTTYSTDAPINAGEYVLKVSIAESANYLAESATKEFTISKGTINQVAFGDVAQPVATETALTTVSGIATGAKYAGTIEWSPELIEGKFDYNTNYTVMIILEITSAYKNNYKFNDNVKLFKPTGSGWIKSTDSNDAKLIYTKTFDATEVIQHSLTEVPFKSATCTEDGHMVAYYCSDCEKYFSDSLGENEIGDLTAYNAWKLNKGKISAHHTVSKVAGIDPTLNRSGYKEAWKCSECNKYFEDEDCTILIGDEETYNTWKTNDGYLAQLPSDGLSAGVIVAICIGSLLLLLIIIYLIGYFFLYRKGKLDEKKIKVIYKFLPRGKK